MRHASPIPALGGLGLLLAAPFTPGYAWGVTGLAAGATGGVLVDIMAGGSRMTRWLECAWLVRLGRISYGVYLWHFPIFIHLSVLRQPGQVPASLGRTALAWSLTVAAALISYLLIERPVLAYKARWSAQPSPTHARLADDPAIPVRGSSFSGT